MVSKVKKRGKNKLFRLSRSIKIVYENFKVLQKIFLIVYKTLFIRRNLFFFSIKNIDFLILDELSTETNAVQTGNNMDSQIGKVMDNVHKVIDGHADIDEQVLDDDQVLDDGQLLEDGQVLEDNQVLEDGQMDWSGGAEAKESLRNEEKIGEIQEPQYPTEPLYQSVFMIIIYLRMRIFWEQSSTDMILWVKS